jgi:hypothetical protein
MLYAFTDESYSPRCYLQAAYVVDESKIGAMRECENLIRENLTKIGVPVDTEFHGHAIMNARKGWQKLEGKFHSKIAVIKALLKEIESIEGYFIIEAIDISIVDSDKEFGIQIADICSYMARRHLDHMERNLRSARIVSEIKSLLDVRTLPSNKREIWSL